jgi:hypothetical protein
MSRLLPGVPEAVFAPVQNEVESMIMAVREAVETRTAAHTLERGPLRQLLQLGHSLFQGFFTLSGPGDVGECLRLEDGRAVKRLAARARPYRNLFGEYTIERFVYGPREGQKLEAIPLDAQLQLPEQCTSYLLQDWNARLMQAMPYAQAEQFLAQLLGVRQSVQTIERDQTRLSAQAEAFWEQLPGPAPLPPEAILVDSVDGKGVCMRPRETGGERGKKKMAILGAVYGIEPYVRSPAQVLAALFAEASAPPNSARPKPLDKHVRACLKRDEADTTALQNEEIFAWIAQQNARRDPAQHHPTVVLIDGQTALWDAAGVHLPGEHVTEILDLLHVCGYVWEAANLLHPNQPQAAQRAVKRDLECILNGQFGTVIKDLQRQAATFSATRRATLERIAGYFATNRHRMAYDLYLAEGFPIATGVIEGACRCLVKDRIERAGMRWVIAGAQSMLALRGISLSGLWEDFIAFRIHEDLLQLYGQEAANADSHQVLAA